MSPEPREQLVSLRKCATRVWLAETTLVAEGHTSLTREGRALPCADEFVGQKYARAKESQRFYLRAREKL